MEHSDRPPVPRRVHSLGLGVRESAPVPPRSTQQTNTGKETVDSRFSGSSHVELHRQDISEHHRSQSLRGRRCRSPARQNDVFEPGGPGRALAMRQARGHSEWTEVADGEQCELSPDHCYVYESIGLLIDLPSSSPCRLVERKCKVSFGGEHSGRQVVVDGLKRNHDYGIKTTSPVWYEKERVTVTVQTFSGQVLAVASFEVLDRTQVGVPLPTVSLCMQKTSDWCSTMFISNIVGAFVPLHPSGSSSTCELYMCVSGSRTLLTELLDRVIGFAMVNGLPQGVSILEMFSNSANLRNVLEASRYARGSLDVLLNTVRLQSRYEYVTDQIGSLLAKVDRPQGSHRNHQSMQGTWHADSQNEEPAYKILPPRNHQSMQGAWQADSQKEEPAYKILPPRNHQSMQGAWQADSQKEEPAYEMIPPRRRRTGTGRSADSNQRGVVELKPGSMLSYQVHDDVSRKQVWSKSVNDKDASAQPGRSWPTSERSDAQPDYIPMSFVGQKRSVSVSAASSRMDENGKDGRKPPTDVTDLSGYTYIDPSKGPSLTESPLTVDAIDSVASRRCTLLADATGDTELDDGYVKVDPDEVKHEEQPNVKSSAACSASNTMKTPSL